MYWLVHKVSLKSGPEEFVFEAVLNSLLQTNSEIRTLRVHLSGILGSLPKILRIAALRVYAWCLLREFSYKLSNE